MSSDSISIMTEILVPLDGREASLRSVPMAARIADRLDLQLRLFGVSEDPEATRSWLRLQAETLLPGKSVTVGAASGEDPAEVIAGEVGPTTLVCIATSATLLPHQGHVGSVAEHVVREVAPPVIMLGPNVDLDPGEPSKRVVVPVDGSELSEQTLSVAGDLARSLGIPAWVVSVIPPNVEAAAGRRLGATPFGAESGYVKGLASDLAKEFGIKTGYEVLHIQDPAEAILDFAGNDSVVVMSTHGRSGLSRVFAGSVAHGVVAGCKRPVVVWRPPDAG